MRSLVVPSRTHLPEVFKGMGTCMIWDRGSHEQLSEEEKIRYKTLDADMLETGVPEALIR